ncbi:DegV family protein [Paenibacillus oenotherae]|uniref:DegV family protein n=1 Tax=Paenibacillus oenotherae TaxID=1435645 RepID=A0ABS7D2J7_9BACL|nr:DegV family protein [Paenibacillus oenotherae]MBW7474152.1 DegV family protein [Paenibacillus oenotherae]
MGKVKIVTDSTADIPLEIRQRLDIEMVPLKVIFGDEAYLDAVEISPSQFYEKLISSPIVPTTSQPSPLDFVKVYEDILKEEPDASIISIHLSSAFSGTYQSAVLGHSMLEVEGDVTIIDSKTASYGFGIMAIKAAEMAAAGESKEAILTEIERLRLDKQIYFLVNTLEYLQKGGRIGKAAALFGSILNVKPILTVDEEGMVTAVDKVRGQKKAMQRIVELFKRDFGQSPVNMIIGWAHNDELAMELAELAKAELNVHSIGKTEIGSVIGTHVGPGTAALFINRV